MTLTLGKAAKPKAPRAPKAPADTARLQRLAARIEELKDHRFTDLLVELKDSDDMKLTEKGDVTHISMAGVKASATAGRHMALSNWANAARRAINQVEGASGQ